MLLIKHLLWLTFNIEIIWWKQGEILNYFLRVTQKSVQQVITCDRVSYFEEEFTVNYFEKLHLMNWMFKWFSNLLQLGFYFVYTAPTCKLPKLVRTIFSCIHSTHAFTPLVYSVCMLCMHISPSHPFLYNVQPMKMYATIF